MLAAGYAVLLEHLVKLREQVKNRQTQCLLTPYARVRTNYLRTRDNRFSLGNEMVLVMPTRDLVLFLINELLSHIQNPENYSDCHNSLPATPRTYDAVAVTACPACP